MTNKKCEKLQKNAYFQEKMWIINIPFELNKKFGFFSNKKCKL